MKKQFSVLLILFLVPIFCNPQAAQSQINTDKLDSFFTTLAENDRFMGSVAVIKNGELLFDSAYGQQDQQGTPAVAETIYRTGSISKSFTAVMIMQLAEEGRLSTADYLSDYFPTIPNADNITIEHLLMHRSGIQSFTSLPDYGNYYTEERSRERQLSHFEEHEILNNPGDRFYYNNTGYVLLGYLIEDLTGMSYAEAVQKKIAEPLGLQSTFAGEQIDPAAGDAQSFRFMNGKWVPQPETHMSIPIGGGNIVSTAAETAAFYRALFREELVNSESIEQMTRFVDGYGYGLFPTPFHDKQAVGHNGSIDGFHSHAAYFADDDIAFALLGNGINYNINEIMIGKLSILFGHDFEIPDFATPGGITLSEEELQHYIGLYTSPGFPLDIRIFSENGVIYGQATGQGPFELKPVSETRMIFEAAGIEINFHPKDEERFRTFTFTQGGMEIEFSLQEE